MRVKLINGLASQTSAGPADHPLPITGADPMMQEKNIYHAHVMGRSSLLSFVSPKANGTYGQRKRQPPLCQDCKPVL